MDESILFPSPNWFQASGLAVSEDGWLVYGGPSKSLCVLEPSPSATAVAPAYQAHVLNRAHQERIISVDISPEWPAKRAVLAGSADGVVKQWIFDGSRQTMKMKSTHSHEVHRVAKEEATGVGYFKNEYAVSVGSHGFIAKWDIKSNVVKSFKKMLGGFKPVCMACSPHLHLFVAIGTKQGVVFVLDLNGTGRVLYKVRGQDDEVLRLSWCPQYEVLMQRSFKDSEKRSGSTKRMEMIRSEPESSEVMVILEQRVQRAQEETDRPKLIKLGEEHILNAEAPQEKTVPDTPKIDLNKLGVDTPLPKDSFDVSVIAEDDMFDIYQEPEDNEFGHKKYQPEYILVKAAEGTKETDYLTECSKLKEDILSLKNEPEISMESLVAELDKIHVVGENGASISQTEDSVQTEMSAITSENSGNQSASKNVDGGESSMHVQKHLLATIGKQGSVRIWSKFGKLVGSCAVPVLAGPGTGTNKNQKGQKINHNATALLWYKPDVLLIGDGKSQLLQCNPLKIDCKNKLDWDVVHSLHNRGLYSVTSGAPRVQSPANDGQSDDQSHDWPVWTVAQDRNMISYSLKNQKKISVHNTCGGFLYTVVTCPYDATKVAISVGDGAVRVWTADTLPEDDTKLSAGQVTTFWQNVQGKVLTVAWHPTRENCLAFATAEARVGLIDTSKPDKPAKALRPSLSLGVYSLCWGEGNDLYACGGGEIIVYKSDQPDSVPASLQVMLEGVKWELNSVRWDLRGIVVGSTAGAVAVLEPHQPWTLRAATFLYNKMIHACEWHPLETSNSNGESPYKNLIAVCSLDKAMTVTILEYGEKEDGTKPLSTVKILSGHTGAVLQLAWNPHVEAQLLSTSQDSTVRIWDVVSGTCTAVFGGHTQSALGAAWSAFPSRSSFVLSGGGDCCLRVWDTADHPPHLYQEVKHETISKRDKKKRAQKGQKRQEDDAEVASSSEMLGAAVMEPKKKCSKKYLLPTIYKHMYPCKITGPRRMLKKYIERKGGDVAAYETESEYDLDYINIFGNINELNEVLEMELERHQVNGSLESWLMLMVLRGHIDDTIQFASERDLLDPYLLSLAPCVSYKYWKDATQLYLAQIDRLVAKEQDSKLNENKNYGGAVYRKTATLLSLHDVKGAVAVLLDARLHKEAYILCRTRYMDSIAMEVLRQWADDCALAGCFNLAAVCYIALEDLSQAAAVLGKSSEEEALSLAADLAKIIGQTTFADHIEEKREQIKTNREATQELMPQLEALPSRVQLMKDAHEQEEGNNEASDKNNIEEMIEELPSKMEVLMKQTQNGDGDLQKAQVDCSYTSRQPNEIGSGDAADNTENDAADNVQENIDATDQNIAAVNVANHQVQENGDQEGKIQNDATANEAQN